MVNKVILIGYLGRDPAPRVGDAPLTFSVATATKFKDKTTGEAKERTNWHQVVIFQPGLIAIAEEYLRKGSRVYVEGAMETRQYSDRDGHKRYVTEVVLGSFGGRLVLLDRANSERAPAAQGDGGYGAEPEFGFADD